METCTAEISQRANRMFHPIIAAAVGLLLTAGVSTAARADVAGAVVAGTIIGAVTGAAIASTVVHPVPPPRWVYGPPRYVAAPVVVAPPVVLVPPPPRPYYRHRWYRW